MITNVSYDKMISIMEHAINKILYMLNATYDHHPRQGFL